MIINSGCLFLFLIFTILLSFSNFQLNWPKFTPCVTTSLLNKISADLIQFERVKINEARRQKQMSSFRKQAIPAFLSKINFASVFENRSINWGSKYVAINNLVAMSDQSIDEEFDPGCNEFTDYLPLESSYNFNSLAPPIPEEDSNFDLINIGVSQAPIKKPTKKKKRQTKYDRLGHEASKDKRDVKKYARTDTIRDIIQKYSKTQGKSFYTHQKLTAQTRVSNRSLKYLFLFLGVLKKEGQLENFYRFFEENSEAILKAKYSIKSQVFKKQLMRSVYYIKKAIELFLEGNEIWAIQVAYTQNEYGEKGRTKIPTQMEKCRRLYENIFTINHNRSNKNDLDMLFI